MPTYYVDCDFKKYITYKLEVVMWWFLTNFTTDFSLINVLLTNYGTTWNILRKHSVNDKVFNVKHNSLCQNICNQKIEYLDNVQKFKL